MRYQIIYQNGKGVKEKEQVKNIYDNISKIAILDIKKLEEDYDKVNKFNSRLLSDISSKYETIKLNFSKINEININIEEKRKIIKDIYDKRPRDIKTEHLGIVKTNETELNKLKEELDKYSIIFTEIRIKLDKLLKDYGSEISGIDDVIDLFGSLGDGKG